MNIKLNKELKRFEVESESLQGHIYLVKWDEGLDELTCNCVYGRHARARRVKPCKHVAAVITMVKSASVTQLERLEQSDESLMIELQSIKSS